MLLSCQVRITAHEDVDPPKGERLLAQAKDLLGAWGGMSCSIGQRSDMGFVSFDPDTTSGTQAIFEFAELVCPDGCTWEVRFHGLD